MPRAIQFLLIYLLSQVLVSVVGGCGANYLTADEQIERAAAYCDSGRGREALQLLDLIDDPTYAPHVKYLRGVAYELTGDLQAAKLAYDATLELSPKDADALNNRGSVLYRLGQLQASVTDLRSATQLNPNDHLAWANLGLTLEALDDLATAADCLRRAYNLQRVAPHATQLGDVILGQQQFEEAEKSYSEAIELESSFAGAYLGRAIARMRLGKIDEANSDLQSARQYDNNLALHGSIQYVRQELDALK